MENASKALIMAGETLIAILVAGLIAYAISTFGNFSKDMNQEMENSRTTEFNSHFTILDGRADITADEITTIINFAKYSNDSYELYLENGYSENKNSRNFVDVIIKQDSSTKSFFNDINNDVEFQNKVKKFLEDYNNIFYMCNISKIKQNGSAGDLTKITRVHKTIPNDIIYDTSSGGTGRVKSIKLSKTSGVSEFKPTRRDEYYIE